MKLYEARQKMQYSEYGLFGSGYMNPLASRSERAKAVTSATLGNLGAALYNFGVNTLNLGIHLNNLVVVRTLGEKGAVDATIAQTLFPK